MLIYISGAPGVGRNNLTSVIKQKGYKVIPELIQPLPDNQYIDLHSPESAEYIWEQNVQRNEMLNDHMEGDELLFVDRHPLENILIAKAYIQDQAKFAALRDRYLQHNWLKGKTIYLKLDPFVQNQRYLFRTVFNAYSDFPFYIKADLELDAMQSMESLARVAISVMQK